MKIEKVIIILIATCFTLGCSSSDDADSPGNDLRNQDITTSENGYTLVHFRSERQSVDLDNPAENISLSKLEEEYYFSANPTKLGVSGPTGQAFFQTAPSADISLKAVLPWNALWLDVSGALQSGAIDGLNYVFFDDNQDEIFETIYMLRLNSSEPENVTKTYLAAKVVKEDGSAIDFVTGKTLLNTLEN